MSFLSQIISGIVRLALTLASLGCLAGATLYIMNQAAHETQRGLVSLGHLNRQLLGNASTANNYRHHTQPVTPSVRSKRAE